MYFELAMISGCMLGIEYNHDDDIVIVDLFFVRVLVYL